MYNYVTLLMFIYITYYS